MYNKFGTAPEGRRAMDLDKICYHMTQALKPGAMDRPTQAVHSHTGRRLSTSGTSPPSGTARMVAAVSGAAANAAASQTTALAQQQQHSRDDSASTAAATAAFHDRERRKRFVSGVPISLSLSDASQQ